MIPMIQQAISMGYTAVQVLNYVSNKFKKAQPGIASARQQGYSDDDILKYLGGKIKPKNKKQADDQLSSQERYLKASGIKSKSERDETKGKFISSALGAGATALGAYSMYNNYGGMLKGLGQTFGKGGTAPQPTSPAPPTVPQNTASQALPAGPAAAQQIQQNVQQPVAQAMQPAAPQQIAQAVQAIPQQQAQQPQSIFKQLMGNVDISTLEPEKVQQLKFLNNVSDQLQAKGKGINDPEFQNLAKKVQETIKGKVRLADQEAARFQEAYPQDQKQKRLPTIDKAKELASLWKQSKEKDPNFPHTLAKVFQTNLGLDAEMSDRLAKTFEEELKPVEKVKEEIKSEQPMAKGSSIITPNGDLGTLEDIPGKAAKVIVDGKQQVFNEEDLTPIPDNHEEIGGLYQKLIDMIPEGQKSRVYDAIGYDPNKNAIKYTYHDGKTYIIDDVPEEIAREIANSGFMAKTSGGNYMGFYYKGNPSIGAGMHILIDDLQKLRGGKGKEYSYKFEELYSQHRLPKNILKEKSDKEKAREREEKKAKKKRSPT